MDLESLYFERTAATAFMQLPKREITCGDKSDFKNTPRFLSAAIKDDLHVALQPKAHVLGFLMQIVHTKKGLETFIEVEFILPLQNSVPLFLCFPVATIKY